ncbi:DUF2341 domain-containing protein [candidate division WWE3 bacterium]|uniref:DUF2341 domain-containing protein n=1 Tax=candidate division WWE3 bacterium TaxID=2053526 RepID=A0A955LK79_UNCKA|nr:DUF2341 domain-containing protein [candidate division WWE3 bacterium]
MARWIIQLLDGVPFHRHGKLLEDMNIKKQKTIIQAITLTLSSLLLLQIVIVKDHQVVKDGDVLGLTQSQVVINDATEFNQGTATTTEVSGSGDSAVVQLQGGAGPDDTVYKRILSIDNTSNSNELTEYQILVEGLDTAALVTAGKMQSDCDDIRFTNTSNEVLPYSLVVQTCNTSDTQIWVQVDTIAASSTTDIYMYYGNPAATAGQSMSDTFSYSSEQVVGLVADTRLAADTLKVLSLEAGNSVSDGTSTLTLGAQGGGSFPASELSVGTEISAKKLMFADGDGEGVDMLTPISYAGTEFVHYSDRSDHYYQIYSHWGNATVTVYNNGSVSWSGTINQYSSQVVNTGSYDDHHVRIVSDIPVYVHHYTISGSNYYDAIVLYPAVSGYLYGVPSNYLEIAAGSSGANVSWVTSAGSTGSQNLSANGIYTSSSLGAQGLSAGYRLSSADTYGAFQLADGDGGENTAFWSRMEMGTKFGSNKVAQYIAVAAPVENTTCTVYNSTGGVPSNPESGYSNPHTAGTRSDVNFIYFGQSSTSSHQWVTAGWMMECDNPVYAYYEADNNSSNEPNDEHNLWSYPQMRQYTYPEPTADIGSEGSALQPSGTWVSASDGNVIDLLWNGGWGDGTDPSTAFSATVADVGANSSIVFKMRVGTSVANMLGQGWTTLGTANSGTSFTKTKAEIDALGIGAGTNRYAQIEVDLSSSNGIDNPKLDDFTLSYQADLDLPTNPSSLIAKDEFGGSTDLTTNTWYNYPNAYFSWSGAVDTDSGIYGYYVYFGTNSSANPQTAGSFQTAANYTTSSLSNNSTYYLRIKAVDLAGNVASTAWAPFIYKYDSGLPTNPSSVSVIPIGYTATDSFRFIWTDNGSDSESGKWGYCYKTGTSDGGSPYYTDQCITGNEVNSVPSYQEGENVFYVRTKDNAGNLSSSYISVKYYYNSTPPSEPQNVVVTAVTSLSGTTCTSLDNCFEVSWDEPASYAGSIDSYYYAVNESVLDDTNTTQTTAGETSTRTLVGRPLANQQGVNEFRIAAKDSTEIIEWANFGSAYFIANTVAPGMPTNMLLTDSSNRDNDQYQLTITWNTPSYTGSGIDHYNIYRSTDGTAFTKIATALGTSTGYLDTGLTKDQIYYYKVSAEDNASNEGSVSSVVSGTPTGRYTTPPDIVVAPTVSASILSATVSWQMERECQGYVQIRTSTTGSYSEQGAGTSSIEHEVSVVGLTASTTYYYRIRCEDEDGNEAFSTESTFVTAGAPSAPTNLAVTPSSNTQNSFAFSWNEPSDIGVTVDYYYYSVNQEPTDANVSRTSLTSLSAGPYATQQGTNTFYVLAVDDAGNYDLDSFASVDFEAATTAPGIPTSMSISDSSDRANELYRLTVAWNVPTTGTVDHYNVYRSIDSESYEQIAETSSLGFFDSGLDTDTKYYYKVTSVDNAASESADSTVVDKQPTGRFPTPPSYTSDPEVEVTSTSATIDWTTDRVSSSFIVFGKTSVLGASSGSLDEVAAHTVSLSGLQPSSTYYYRLQSFDDARDYELSEALSELYTFKTSVAPAISDVKVEEVRQTTAIVTWRTSTVSSTTVKYGKTNSYGLEIDDESTGATTVHTVRLTDLDAENLYHLRISGTDVEGNILESDDYVFQTLAFPRIFNVTFEPVTDASSATIKVAWETNVDTDSIVEYRPQGGAFVESVTSELLTEHELVLSNLLDNTSYEFRSKGRDQYGNIATSDLQIYSTPFDTRPPKISDIVVETAILGSGQEATAQIIVSWKTDENATSQVEYGEGVGGTTYPNKTVEDGVLTNSHVVIISDVVPSKPYHLRVVSRDGALNDAASSDYAVITGRATDSVLDLIIFNLQDTFGWLGQVFNVF